MKRLGQVLMAPRAVLAAASIVLATNAAMLGSAAWNRSGAPRATLRLTERELALPGSPLADGDEIFLKVKLGHEPPLAERVAAMRNGVALADDELPWLDTAKLEALGFARDLRRWREEARPPEPGHDHGRGAMPRRAFIALEYEGEAWSHWLATAESKVAALRASHGDSDEVREAEALLAIDRVQRSRLFAIDADLDAAALEQRILGRPNVVVVRGLVMLGFPVRAHLTAPLPSDVRLPQALRPHVAPFAPPENVWDVAFRDRDRRGPATWPAPVPPRYELTLAIGRSREPWIADE